MTLAQTIRDKRLWLLPLLALLALAYAPVYPRMIVNDWLGDPNYSHGFLVPLVSAWFIHAAWPRLRQEEVVPSNAGFLLLIFGIALLSVGVTLQEIYSSRASLIFILAGLIHIFCGGRILRLLALPLAYLFFMIPLPYTIYDMLALPLRSLVTFVATGGLKACGLAVLREGNMILFPNISLEVVEACSGMRSLVSLVALGTAWAFVFLRGNTRRALLILATVPIAVITNISRVFITGLLARHVGAQAAEGFFHDFAGFAVFAVAMLLTLLTGWILSKLPLDRVNDEGNDNAS